MGRGACHPAGPRARRIRGVLAPDVGSPCAVLPCHRLRPSGFRSVDASRIALTRSGFLLRLSRNCSSCWTSSASVWSGTPLVAGSPWPSRWLVRSGWSASPCWPPPCRDSPSGPRCVYRLMSVRGIGEILSAFVTPGICAAALRRCFATPQPDEIAFLVGHQYAARTTPEGRAAYLATLRGVKGAFTADAQTYRAALADWERPTLMIHGRQDPVVPLGHAEAAAKAIPAWRRDGSIAAGTFPRSSMGRSSTSGSGSSCWPTWVADLKLKLGNIGDERVTEALGGFGESSEAAESGIGVRRPFRRYRRSRGRSEAYGR